MQILNQNRTIGTTIVVNDDGSQRLLGSLRGFSPLFIIVPRPEGVLAQVSGEHVFLNTKHEQRSHSMAHLLSQDVLGICINNIPVQPSLKSCSLHSILTSKQSILLPWTYKHVVRLPSYYKHYVSLFYYSTIHKEEVSMSTIEPTMNCLCINRRSIRIRYINKEGKLLNGRVSSYRLNDYIGKSKNDDLRKGEVCLIWEDDRQYIMSADKLVAYIYKSGATLDDDIIKEVYRISNERRRSMKSSRSVRAMIENEKYVRRKMGMSLDGVEQYIYNSLRA